MVLGPCIMSPWVVVGGKPWSDLPDRGATVNKDGVPLAFCFSRQQNELPRGSFVMAGEIRKYPDESSGLLLLASDIGLCTERRLYQSLCLPAGVPSDQSATTTKNTRIGGSPFIWDGSFDEKNQ